MTPRLRRLLLTGVMAPTALLLSCAKDHPKPTPPLPGAAPTAFFTMIPDSGTTATVFQFDADESSDPEDAASVLRVRWDWEEDGTWDTDYALAKTASHQYGTSGTKKVRLEVRDTVGLTGTTTTEVAIGSAPLVTSQFILVLPGTFTMGSPPDEPGRDAEESLHPVTLTRAVYVSRYEATQSEWVSVMEWDESGFDGPNRPVEQVTWFDAVKFCNACSHRDGYRPVYEIADEVRDSLHVASATVTWNREADGYRLLTESEWEYACRAGSSTALGNGAITTPIGCSPLDPNFDQVGWYCGNSTSGTHDVGGKAPNAGGLQDMHGNVWEWCWDWYAAAYPDGPVSDPVGPDSGNQRVIRGGGWDHSAGSCRCASRGVLKPGHRGSMVGVRLARTAQTADRVAAAVLHGSGGR